MPRSHSQLQPYQTFRERVAKTIADAVIAELQMQPSETMPYSFQFIKPLKRQDILDKLCELPENSTGLVREYNPISDVHIQDLGKRYYALAQDIIAWFQNLIRPVLLKRLKRHNVDVPRVKASDALYPNQATGLQIKRRITDAYETLDIIHNRQYSIRLRSTMKELSKNITALRQTREHDIAKIAAVKSLLDAEKAEALVFEDCFQQISRPTVDLVQLVSTVARMSCEKLSWQQHEAYVVCENDAIAFYTRASGPFLERLKATLATFALLADDNKVSMASSLLAAEILLGLVFEKSDYEVEAAY
ncbi:hypothetical protein BDQ12DRAFT_180390 [Crucibulum laeve]|uniref:Uncharacterized protein n=1 Tax=Crucibulum laeve TaxID=68775 RepID=A0A5C3MFM5_9AGAR|nr:hypothetical protein BDQ12DRAFT_180390 [Crucibulum laeve]